MFHAILIDHGNKQWKMTLWIKTKLQNPRYNRGANHSSHTNLFTNKYFITVFKTGNFT